MKYEEKDGHLHLYLSDKEKNYSISATDLGQKTNWNLFCLQSREILFLNVSKWALHLCTTRGVDYEFIFEFVDLIKERVPHNQIDWDATFKAIEIHKEYYKLNLSNEMDKTVDSTHKSKRKEVIDYLKNKYKL